MRRWQAFLVERGFAYAASIDGIFGEQTLQGTRAFQAVHALAADGVVGTATLAMAVGLGHRELRRLQAFELTPAVVAHAKRILGAYRDAPYGSEYPFELEGASYVARIEEHYNAPGGAAKPWGHHPGVALFKAVRTGHDLAVHDEVSSGPGERRADDEVPVLATRGLIALEAAGCPGAGIEGCGGDVIGPSGVTGRALSSRMGELIRKYVAERAIDVRVELEQPPAGERLTSRADVRLNVHFGQADGRTRGVEAWVESLGGDADLANHRFAQRLVTAVYKAIGAFDSGCALRGVREMRERPVTRTAERHDLRGGLEGRSPTACTLQIEFLDVPRVDELFNVGKDSGSVRVAVADAIGQVLLDEISF